MKKCAEEYLKTIKPGMFITLDLKQGIGSRRGSYIPGSYEAYDRCFRGVLDNTMRLLTGKRAWRRKRARLKHVTTLERGWISNLWHIHSCIEIPPDVSYAELAEAFHKSWSASKWAGRFPKVEPVYDPLGCMRYVLKGLEVDAELIP